MASEMLTESLQETLAVFDQSGTPRTTTEVAADLDLGRRSVYDRLQRLVDRDRLATKKVGASARVWWQPGPAGWAGAASVTVPPDGGGAAESLVDDVLERADVGIFVIDEEKGVVWANTAVEEYFGLERGIAVGRDKPTLVEEHVAGVVADGEAFAETVLAAYDDNTYVEQFECRVTAGPNRRERWLEHTSKPIETGVYAGGRVELYYDVTEHRIDDGFYVIDETGHFRTITDSVGNVLGYDPDDLVGDCWFEHVHPDDRERARQAFAGMVADPASEPTLEVRFRHSDGSWVSLEARGRNLIDDRAIGGIIVYTRDVTARNDRERKLQQQVAKQAVVAQLGQQALETHDTDALLSSASRLVAETLGNDFCKVLELDADGECLHLRAGVGWADRTIGSASVSAVESDSQAAYTLGTSEPVVVENLDAESRFSGPALLTDHDINSGISVLIGTPEDPWGVLGTHDTGAATFSDSDVSFVQSVANVLAGAIDRQRYEAELIHQRGELATREATLRRASEVMSRPDRALSAQLHELLGVAGEALGTDYMALVTRADGEWGFECVETAGEPERERSATVPAAVSADCERVLESDRAIFVSDRQPFLGVQVGLADGAESVLCCYETDGTASFTDWEVAFAELVANWVHSEHRREQSTDRLAALNELNTVAREITDAVIDRSTRREIEQTVCDHLAASDSYRFAWVGDVDVPTQTVVLHAEAGVEGYLDGITISVEPDDERSDGPTGRAIRTGEMQVTQDTRTDRRHDPWRDHIEAHEVRSSAAVPIIHEESLYGVLNIYADRPRAFEGQEATVLRQLGEVVGHAIAATDRKQALMGDELVELEFQVPNLRSALDIGEPLSGHTELTHTVPLGDSEYLVYGTATADGLGSLRALVDAVPHWTSVTVHGGEDGGRFELRLSESPVLSGLAAVGGSVHRAVVEDNELILSIRLPPSADTRRVIDVVQEAYPTAELLKHRQRTRADANAVIQTTLTETLTDRQRTALQTAYHAGFFEWPRDVSGEILAASLGVSAPTFHQHLRKAQRKLLAAVLAHAPPTH